VTATPQRWLILADDLTGAADSAVPFARRRAATIVTWDELDGGGADAAVLAHDVDSRALPAHEAALRHRAALARLGATRRLFKKIDSTLRGQPAAELAATLAALKADGRPVVGVLAPAFPAVGRTTIDGRVRLAGQKLEDCELWRECGYSSADLHEVMRTAGLATLAAPLAQVRSPGRLATLIADAAARDAVLICDAETDADLRLVAEAGLAATTEAVFVGSGGLAHALAACTAILVEDMAPEMPRSRGGVLLVVGSLAEASRAAARNLVRQERAFHVALSPDFLLDGAEEERRVVGEDVAARLAKGEDVLVEMEAAGLLDLSVAARLAVALADVLAPAAPCMGAFAATGGETAGAVLRRFGVDGVRLIDEIEPGVPLGLTFGAMTVPIATKAGAFGDEDSLIRIADRLRALRTIGSPP
jgi:D-threonate/D-erythronate kinase